MLTQTQINQRWLRATQILNGIPAVGGIIIAIMTLLQPDRIKDPNWVIFLTVIIGGVHTFEEYTFPGGFIRWFNTGIMSSPDANAPLSIRSAFFYDAVAGIVIILAIILLGTQVMWLVLGAVSVMFINGMLHVMDSVVHGRYAPGMVSSLLLNIPLGAYIIHFYWANGQATLMDVAIAYMMGWLAHVYLFASLRRSSKNQMVQPSIAQTQG
ncbi:MAG: HXXEE domain-containing protein [Anaerolineaceae bacterium]|nr:HXXEE domain-containing protein [Anaerolineaceae bacterium]